MLTQLLDLFILRDLPKTHPAGNLPVHSQHRRNLLLCQQQDLQHQMVAFGPTPAHAGLPHQNKAGQQNRFQRDNSAEQRVGSRIEVVDVSNPKRIHRDPSGKYCDVNADKKQTAGEGRYRIAESFRPCSPGEALLFVLGNQIDMFLNRLQTPVCSPSIREGQDRIQGLLAQFSA